jgi:hypothetical protein
MELVLPDPADHLAIFGLLVIAPKEIHDRPDASPSFLACLSLRREPR